MTIIQYKSGNILDVERGIICHQVNHKGVSGAGLAKQIKTKYPGFEKDYLEKCKKMSFSTIRMNGIVSFYQPSDDIIIASIFGQDGFGTDKRHTDYDALKSGLQTVMRAGIFNNLPVAIPYKIGCGLGGGNWKIVLDVIETVFRHCSLDVAIYKLA